MADPVHIERLLQGVDAWNKWRMDQPETAPDLRGLDFTKLPNVRQTSIWGRSGNFASCEGTFLEREQVVLRGINLNHAYLNGANLVDVSFRGAVLDGASFWDASISHCDFHEVSARQTQFDGATVSLTSFMHSDLYGSKWSGATCDSCKFTSVTMDHIFAPEAVFSKCQFYNVTDDEVRFPGAEFHQSVLSRCKFRWPTFTEADFSGARLEDIVFKLPDLRGTLWRDSYVIAMSIRAKELEGLCYGAAGEGCRGDMRFRRLLMDQSYIDAMYIAAFDLTDQGTSYPEPPNSDLPAFAWPGGFRSWWPCLCGFGGVLAGYGVSLAEFAAAGLLPGSETMAFRSGSARAVAFGVLGFLVAAITVSIRDPRAKLSLWRLFDYGRSWKSVGMLAALSVTLFGFLYAILDGSSIAFTHKGPTVAGITYPWFVAAMGFATLGISDLVEPLSIFGQVIMVANVLSGFATLGVLLSILGSAFARRS